MIRFAILYFVMLVLFVALVAGPTVAGRFFKTLPDIPMQLLQPTGLNNNDTTSETTGRGLNDPAAPTGAASSSAAATSS